MREIPGYSLIRRIDKGGMTNLYVARSQGQMVVLRSINDQYAKDKKVVKSFRHGIKVLEGMSHPGIIRLVDHGVYRGTDYMAVEYHENLNLRERIGQKDPLLAKYQYNLILQLAEPLAQVHHAGYLHMDLKPENILVRDDTRMVLVDFDLAIRHRNKMKKYKSVSGTASYLAPETLADGMLGESSEIFSFGVCAYEILTLRKPFDAASAEAYRKIVSSKRAKPTDIRHYRPDVPPALANVVMNCLENDPQHRYPTMRMVLRDLKKMK